ncbi:MAG: polyamine ABC transporter substrate-binding protein [Alphaproteobacteria bacterium]|nr:polyamine ABC transporter substrate-binding protein [Alphaproteobacteria bacterium]
MKTTRTMLLAATALACASAPAFAQKVLSVGMAAQDVQQMDPHRAVTTQDRPLASWLFNGLVRLKPGSVDLEAIEPDLAESFESSADRLTWTFKLRRGVQFHKGFGELTADDVVFSIQRSADAKTSAFSSSFAAVDKVEAVDSHTVRITLKNRVPFFLGSILNYEGGFIVSKKAVEQAGDNFKTAPVGTGPFAFQEHKANDRVTFAAHAGYFRGKPKIDTVHYRFIQSDASRDIAFQAGEIQVIYGRQDQVWVERMKKEPNTVVDVIAPAEFSLLHLNTKQKPLDDKRVRLAIAHAVNRDELVRAKGALIAKGGTSLIPSGYLGSDPNAGLPAHDIAKAKALLAEAGFPNGVQVKAIHTQLPGMLQTIQVVQAQLKRAGIDLVIDLVDHQTFHAQIRQDLSQITHYSAGRFPVADIYLTQFYHSRSIVKTPTAVTNFSHCAVADADIDAARVETDPAKQKQFWFAAQRKIIDEVCAVALQEGLSVWARKGNVDYGHKPEGYLNLGPTLSETTTLN